MAGVRTAVVMNIGVAAVAYIGAGGLEPLFHEDQARLIRAS
ncbi:MAG: hypothetical protein R3E89_16190 [Thiolinea sp.]